MSSYLDGITGPQDLKKLNIDELVQLAGEIRSYIIEVLSENGGHLASNLGAVELTLALHYVFDSPKDKLIFDVGHQSYTHKIVTGRRDAFRTVRLAGGLSGFPKRDESPHDAFDTGHSSTSISAGLGYARARDLTLAALKERLAAEEKGSEAYERLAAERREADRNVVAVIGDGAIGSGMAFEALNDLGHNKTRMLIVLNDNEMSISKNVGALSDDLARLRVSRRYLRFKDRFSRFLKRIPLVGKEMYTFAKRTKNAVKRLVVKNLIFEHMGLTYLGPIDGHNLKDMIEILSEARDAEDPVLLHVVTQKGRGYHAAEREPARYHGVSENLAAPNDADTFSACAGKLLTSMAERDERVCAITAAMAEGTGLAGFGKAFPHRFFDVGISEQHAVTFAAGLAAAGYRPFVCIYSTFLQRAYDQILHDVCLQNLPVVFLIDRAGVSGRDGETHQGVYDISYLSAMPNIEVYQPASYTELSAMLDYAEQASHPVAIRYPHGRGARLDAPRFDKTWAMAVDAGAPVTVLAVGSRMFKIARHAAACCAERGIAANVADCSTIKPLDTAFLDRVAGHALLTLEDGVLRGGFYEAVRCYYAGKGVFPAITPFGFPDVLPQGSVAELFERAGVTERAVMEAIERAYR